MSPYPKRWNKLEERSSRVIASPRLHGLLSEARPARLLSIASPNMTRAAIVQLQSADLETILRCRKIISNDLQSANKHKQAGEQWVELSPRSLRSPLELFSHHRPVRIQMYSRKSAPIGRLVQCDETKPPVVNHAVLSLSMNLSNASL